MFKTLESMWGQRVQIIYKYIYAHSDLGYILQKQN